MKYLSIHCALFAVLALSATSVSALPDGSAPPSMMDMSATFAKTRAQLRAYDMDVRDTGTDVDPFEVGALDTAGCDINVGNVVLDDTAGAPNDIIIFVQGDIMQANNCR
ncbi:hypothetical protein [Thiothrix subterranea]|uniref:Uncharacterized protein n=1 Tax=Thiothrix subterranea TaxID=2735563 RepID=A0AA51MMS4_9GAMM|nr:hypothetical protein [Thiothrix subterranea]MDQ5770353.1 hypothetical protein [Thiothrix subterranea]QQZ28261.1 hypothetical protein HMY34_05540 [Thiothrix subterranea]WML86790.1 hypothetical protein RCG00_21220 [Thiothrix subterranea]